MRDRRVRPDRWYRISRTFPSVYDFHGREVGPQVDIHIEPAWHNVPTNEPPDYLRLNIMGSGTGYSTAILPMTVVEALQVMLYQCTGLDPVPPRDVNIEVVANLKVASPKRRKKAKTKAVTVERISSGDEESPEQRKEKAKIERHMRGK